MRAFLVRAHQARIARHISGEDRGQTAGRGHCFDPQRQVLMLRLTQIQAAPFLFFG
jgi:hypothetical protein